MVMTDPGLTGVLDGDESPTDTAEDLLSAHEVVPKHLKAEPETEPCPYCDKTFKAGGFGRAHLANHIKYTHKDKAPLKKTPPPRASRSSRSRRRWPRPCPSRRPRRASPRARTCPY
jgi:3-hydroxyacyl-CoA dehydrogenase